jgi:Domain of unknown function (DUF4383)
MVRTYAQVVGIVLLVLGVLGLILGEGQLGGQINIDIVEDFIHIVTGALLVYAAFGRIGAGQARSLAIGVGIFYLLVALLGFADPSLFGLLPTGYTVADNLIHLVIGLVLVAIGYGARSASRNGTRRSWRRRR